MRRITFGYCKTWRGWGGRNMVPVVDEQGNKNTAEYDPKTAKPAESAFNIVQDFNYTALLSPKAIKRMTALHRLRTRLSPKEFSAFIDASEKKHLEARRASSERGWAIQNKAVKP